MNTQPQLLPKYKKLNSLQRRLESWLINYQGTLPIDAQLCFEQLGLEYTQKNYKKFYQALWETNNCPDARVSFRLKDFYFAEFEPEQKVTHINIEDLKRFSENAQESKSGKLEYVDTRSYVAMKKCYDLLVELPTVERKKVLQSLTIML